MSNIVVSGTGSASLSLLLFNSIICQFCMIISFKKSHPLLAILKGKAKTFNGREIVVPVEYADGGSSVFGDKHALGNAYTPAVADITKDLHRLINYANWSLFINQRRNSSYEPYTRQLKTLSVLKLQTYRSHLKKQLQKICLLLL